MIFGLFGGGSSSSNVPDIDYETPDSLKPFLNYSSRKVLVRTVRKIKTILG